MAFSTRVFVARLAGLSVFGPSGESIGRVRDVVAAPRLDAQPPRALGIVVELPNRRPVFVPMLRVGTFDTHGIALVTGQVSMRRFEQRPTEILVLGRLVGTKVRIATTQSTATVADAAIEQSRTRDWDITRLAVRERAGRLARRTPVQVLNWSEVRGTSATELLGGGAAATRQLLQTFEGMRAADAAGVLRDLPAASRYELVDALPDDRLADVLEELPDDDRTELLTRLHEDRAADVLEAMDPDDAADLLGELSPAVRSRLLELMEPEDSAPVRRLLQYSSDTAGGLMTSQPIILTPDATNAEALARVRAPEHTPALASMVFVVRPPQSTPTGRYLGCVHTQRLLRDPPFELVAGALDTDMARLSPDASLAEVTRYFATYNLVCAPVVDDDEHLLGAVTVDDVLDHLLPENWREQSMDEMVADAVSEPGTGVAAALEEER